MAERLNAGDVVERYRVELLLGEGGVAAVYRVRHAQLGTVHALKVLTLDHPRLRERLLREGKAQASLDHENIVPVRDVIDCRGSPALLMDFVPGGSLQERIAQRGPLPVDEIVHLFSGIVLGVRHAHAMGIVHRDLKPSNILLQERDGKLVPRVADFGIARHLTDLETGTFRTRAGMLGTPDHMAPEQARDARNADERSDVFSLGSILYELATGRPPYAGADAIEVLNKAAAGDHIDPATLRPGLPPSILAVIAGCLQPSRDRRLPSCDAVLRLLEGDPDAPTLVPATTEIPVELPVDRTYEPDDAPPQPAATPRAPSRPSEAPSGRGSATAGCLVVDQTGQGHKVDVVVIVDDGVGTVVTPSDVARDTEVAAQVAVAAALGPDADRCHVQWAIRGAEFEVHGTSVGLAVAVAVMAARHRRSIPEGWAFTGGVDLDGRVVSVSGVPAKVRAAFLAQVTTVAVPLADSLGLEVPSGHELVAVERLQPLCERLGVAPVTRPWKRHLPLAGAMAVVLFCTFTDVFSNVDGLVQYPLLQATRDLHAEHTVVLGIERPPDLRLLRAEYGEVMKTAARAGATAVVLDVALSAETEHDEGLAAAIAEARGLGTAVVVPIRFSNAGAGPPGSAAIRDAAQLGAVEACRELFLGWVRCAVVEKRTLAGESYWHAAVLAAGAHVAARVPPRREGLELVIGPLRNAVRGDQLFLYPIDDVPVFDYADPDSWRDQVRGKVAVIGLTGGIDDVHRVPWGTAWGPEVVAVAVETLVRQAAPRLPPVEWNVLIALATAGATAGVGALLPAKGRLFALLVPLAVLVVLMALLAAGWLFSPFSVVAAGAAGAALVTRQRRRP